MENRVPNHEFRKQGLLQRSDGKAQAESDRESEVVQVDAEVD